MSDTENNDTESFPDAPCSAMEDAFSEIGDSEVDWENRDFSGRTKKLLKKIGVINYRDLVDVYTTGKLASFQGVGRKTYNEVTDHLHSMLPGKLGYKPNWKPFRDSRKWKFDPYTGEKL